MSAASIRPRLPAASPARSEIQRGAPGDPSHDGAPDEQQGHVDSGRDPERGADLIDVDQREGDHGRGGQRGLDHRPLVLDPLGHVGAGHGHAVLGAAREHVRPRVGEGEDERRHEQRRDHDRRALGARQRGDDRRGEHGAVERRGKVLPREQGPQPTSAHARILSLRGSSSVVVLLALAIIGLFFLPDPWRVVASSSRALIEVAEVFLWIKFLRRYRVTTGAEGMIGERAEVIGPLDPRAAFACAGRSGTRARARRSRTVARSGSRRSTA